MHHMIMLLPSLHCPAGSALPCCRTQSCFLICSFAAGCELKRLPMRPLACAEMEAKASLAVPAWVREQLTIVAHCHVLSSSYTCVLPHQPDTTLWRIEASHCRAGLGELPRVCADGW